MAWYIQRLQRAWRDDRGRTPFVVPLLVSQRRSPWSAPLRLTDLADCPEPLRDAVGPHAIEQVVPCFDLARWTPEALASRPGPPLAGLALALLRRAAAGPDGALEVLEQLAARFRALGRGPNGKADLGLLETYTVFTSESERGTVVRRVGAALELGRRDMKMLGERLKTEGKREMLLELLEMKFGPLSAANRRRVERASDAEVPRWARKFATAERLEDVLPPGRRTATPRSTRRPAR